MTAILASAALCLLPTEPLPSVSFARLEVNHVLHQNSKVRFTQIICWDHNRHCRCGGMSVREWWYAPIRGNIPVYGECGRYRMLHRGVELRFQILSETHTHNDPEVDDRQRHDMEARKPVLP